MWATVLGTLVLNPAFWWPGCPHTCDSGSALTQIDRLIHHGADILNPVTLTQGDRVAVGTAVDYGYFKFYQVWL